LQGNRKIIKENEIIKEKNHEIKKNNLLINNSQKEEMIIEKENSEI